MPHCKVLEDINNSSEHSASRAGYQTVNQIEDEACPLYCGYGVDDGNRPSAELAMKSSHFLSTWGQVNTSAPA